jgi:uncharacterized cupin superfamily protein
MAAANLYDTPGVERSVGHIGGLWRELGDAAGTRAVGLRRIEVLPGHFSTPAHEHGAEEEIFFVLGGAGLLWQDGETVEVATGDCIVHLPGNGVHTLRAGDGGLDVLVFGQRLDAALTALPRAGVAWSGARFVELGQGDKPFRREAAVGPPECPEPPSERPANVVALAAPKPEFDGQVRLLGAEAGSRAAGLNHITLEAGASGAPPHCHSAEEEIFVVLDGDGALELWPRGGGEPDTGPLRRGDVIARPPGSGVAHALRAGEDGLRYLAYGTRDTGDMCFYPQSGRVSLRGLGITLSSPAIEPLRGP